MEEEKVSIINKAFLFDSTVWTQGENTKHLYHLYLMHSRPGLYRYNQSLTQGIVEKDYETLAAFILLRIEKEAKIKIVKIENKEQRWSYNIKLDNLEDLMRAHEWLVNLVASPTEDNHLCGPDCKPYLIYMIRDSILYYDRCCNLYNPMR
jgi:hypothetical protein